MHADSSHSITPCVSPNPFVRAEIIAEHISLAVDDYARVVDQVATRVRIDQPHDAVNEVSN